MTLCTRNRDYGNIKSGTTSSCTAHHTPVRWRLCAVKQLELIPGLLAGLFLLSPGAPVNNCLLGFNPIDLGSVENWTLRPTDWDVHCKCKSYVAGAMDVH